MTVAEVFAAVSRVLAARVWHPQNEAVLQDAVAAALATAGELSIDREVIAGSGRFDLAVRPLSGSPLVVVELKLRAAVAAVERQAQRYALDPKVDGVMVVTTSRTLAAKLADLRELGGKPFLAVGLRSF